MLQEGYGHNWVAAILPQAMLRKLTDEAHQLEITDAFKMLHSELWNGDDYREGSGVGLSFSCVSDLHLKLMFLSDTLQRPERCRAPLTRASDAMSACSSSAAPCGMFGTVLR